MKTFSKSTEELLNIVIIVNKQNLESTMKFSIPIAVIGVSKFTAVAGERISFGEKRRRESENEDSFWSSFVIQDLDSMTIPVPNPTPAPDGIVSDAPSDVYAFSNPPTISGTSSGTSSGTTSGTSSGTSSGTTSETKNNPACNSIGR